MNQNFCSVLLRKSCLNLQKFVHNSGIDFKSHYDTLNLQRNCTSKEIRDSFIKLSKQNHPDINKNPKAHQNFLKIQEAYNVLSKSASRTSYDLGLSKPYYSYHNDTTNVRSRHTGRYSRTSRDQWDNPFFYNRTRHGAQYEEPEQPYYGVKGINKVSNELVAFVVIMLAAASFFGQMILINYSFTLQRDNILKKSQETQETLNDIRSRAHRNGNEMQVEILQRHFEEVERQREKFKETVD